jgi:hypothetical protein
MFFLTHALHITGPLAIALPVAMIALRLILRRTRSTRR